MQISDRVRRIKSPAAWAVLALVNSLREQGREVINFGTGEPDFDTPGSIKKAAMRAIESGKTKYTLVGGVPELKAAIIEKFKRDNDLAYEKYEVTVNCGGKHSMYNLMQVLLNDGDEVIIPAPYWESYPPMVLLAGGRPVTIATDESSGFKIDPDTLERVITKRTRAIILNSPSNPAGAVYTCEELEALSALLVDRDITIISDDIYEYIIYDDTAFSNMAMLSEDLKRKTIILNGVSKAYAMTGWRIGYLAGDREIIKWVETLQSQSTSNPSSISQFAAVEAIAGDQTATGEMVEAFARRRQLIVKGLNEVPGFSCMEPQGAFYAFPNISGVKQLEGWNALRRRFGGDSCSSILIAYLLEEAGIAAVPGIEFGCDDNIRLSFATSDENIGNGVTRIKMALEMLG